MSEVRSSWPGSSPSASLVAVWATALITTVLITERGEGGQLGFEPLIDLIYELQYVGRWT